MPEVKEIKVILSGGTDVEFTGFYRRDLETANWHYYQITDGAILSFRKSKMEAVLEGDDYLTLT